MRFHRPELVQKLAHEAVSSLVSEILTIASQGFDVFVSGSHVGTNEMIFSMLQGYKNQFCIQLGSSELPSSEVRRLIVVGTHQELLPYGFIRYNVPSVTLDQKQIHSHISTILEFYSISKYVDVFDRSKVTYLRGLTKNVSFDQFIDVVLQIAFKAGYLGEENAASDDLKTEFYCRAQTNAESSITTIFETIVEKSHRPHCFLKAALSHYMVKHRNFTSSHASRVLEISRATLSQHLRLAESLNVEEILFSKS